MEIDRRHILLGAGMALTLSACEGRKGGSEPKMRATDECAVANLDWLAFRGIEPDWNFGDDPWESFSDEVADENPRPTATFAPDYIAVLHLEVGVNPFKLKATRAHFPRNPMTSNDLAGIEERVIAVIKYLNRTITDKPPYLDLTMVREGLRGFGFTRPHHFIIYIKNKGVSYDPDYPVWFGAKLSEGRTIAGTTDYRADPNRSFYDAEPKSTAISGGNESDEFIYIKNYFYTADETGDERKPNNRHQITTTENKKYSININAALDSSDTSPLKIPLVIDPDTGNMGGGGGGALP